MCDAFRETLRVIIIRILEWMQALLMLMRSHGGQTFTDSTGSLLWWDVGPEHQRFNAPNRFHILVMVLWPKKRTADPELWWWNGEMGDRPVLEDLCNVGGSLPKCTMCKPGGVNDRTGLKMQAWEQIYTLDLQQIYYNTEKRWLLRNLLLVPLISPTNLM